MSRLRVTADTNVLRDMQEAGRPDHEAALELLRLHEAGIVDVGVSSRYKMDIPEGPLRARIEALSLVDTPVSAPFRVGFSRLGDDYIVSAQEVALAKELFELLYPGIDRQAHTGANRRRISDVDALLGHCRRGRDVFLTRDRKILAGSAALWLRHRIKTMTPLEFLDYLDHGGCLFRIDRLAVRNFRGFQTFDARFHPQTTVLIGANGAGKSAILDALAVAIGSWFINLADVQARSIVDEEIRLMRTAHGNDTVRLEPIYPVEIHVDGRLFDRSLSWSRELRKKGGKTTYGSAAELRSWAAEAQKAVSTGAPVDLPVIAYYGTGRLWSQKQMSVLKTSGLGSRFNGYTDCLDPASNQKLFEAWMRWREQDRLQQIAAALDRGESPTLVRLVDVEAVEQAVLCCVEGATGLSYSLAYEELRLTFIGGHELPFSRLSDGYRNLLGMVADIAWRAVQLNPHHGGEAGRKAEGVVLINEIDLHLHPSWQHQVLDDLRRAFPKIQLIVTTHSPQVIATARREWMRLLVADAGGALPTEPVHGRDSNAILREIMGVRPRPQSMEEKLDRIESLIEDAKLAEAKALLGAIRSDLGDHDREVVRLEWEIHDLEVNDAPDH
ncbi:MAG: AAA family ATPase [Candidatus Schekmanbacteria bacterium]|nr:AAA family ATPase [Candidatus Schekmanbacteria bacterium]